MPIKQLTEAGARHSKADQNMVQDLHDKSVGLGADCGMAESMAPWVPGQLEALTEAALRQADSMDAKRSAISKAVSQTYDSSMHYPYVRDAFDKHVVVQHGLKMFKHPYSHDAATGVVTLGNPQEVESTYTPVRAAEAALYSDEGQPLYERNIPQSTRDKAKAGDFAGKGTSFPILKAEDVSAALKSIGRAGSDNYDHATLKANILRIAKRKGFAVPEADKTEAADITFLGDLVPLVESGMRADGTIPIKVIAPGWGSSGYYPAEVLERDGPKVFAKGTQMFLDHPTDAEESDRPERSVKDLAAALTSDARWEATGKAGPGLYADAQVFEPFRPFINEASKSIGVSIRAMGAAESGTAEGRTGPIIKKLSAAKSIDFVTAAGAGGKILQLYEAATRRITEQGDVTNMVQIDEKELATLRESAELSKRLAEGQLIRDAGEIVTREVSKRKTLPEMTSARLIESLKRACINPPLKEGKIDEPAIVAMVEAAVKAEQTYLTEVLGLGKVVGMGGTTADAAADKADAETVKESEASLLESFKSMGMSDKTAQLAVSGRK
jgi:hypothetical protein